MHKNLIRSHRSSEILILPLYCLDRCKRNFQACKVPSCKEKKVKNTFSWMFSVDADYGQIN